VGYSLKHKRSCKIEDLLFECIRIIIIYTISVGYLITYLLQLQQSPYMDATSLIVEVHMARVITDD